MLKEFPHPYYSTNLVYKITNSFKPFDTKTALDQCRKLISVSIYLKDFKMCQKALFSLILEGRLMKQYKDFVFNKKDLEIEIVKRIISDASLIEQAVFINATEFALFFLSHMTPQF